MLNELPESVVDNLCDILHKEWPRTIPAINHLRTCREWKMKNPNLDMQILYNEKNIQSGVFILIHKSGCKIPVLTMYALDSYENELETIFSQFLDKYNKPVLLSAISKKYIPMVEKVVDAKTYKTIRVDYILLSMDVDKAKNLEISYPSDVEIKPLNKEHLKNIYDQQLPIVQYIFNLEDFENRLELNNEFGVGIFSKETGRLLSRCMRSYDGSICSLHTVEEARGKGYAKLLLKHVSKKLAQLSATPYLFTDVQNENCLKAAQDSGFHIVSPVSIAIIGESAALMHIEI